MIITRRICGKDNHRKDRPLYHGGEPQIYTTQEVQTVGNVGSNIPYIYPVVDNKQAGHQASIIEMEGKLCF